ncbi:acyl-CoA dehydrogenase family protein [Streptomyces sp. SP18CS02]|uniref:acyl-CoA dehydrogenase family protein n=1 Tax=Streptomyces sp. SP18CS02 TaxID=3002531 RepID=UPI002E780738|nr:acyl-CoA dehydrogenase family protein [Streptomyces sp. SP18CS02]MEE1756446.1 acyl-CoA dehydrogenase family protein [Streptomyces sp. SP18CS02]
MAGDIDFADDPELERLRAEGRELPCGEVAAAAVAALIPQVHGGRGLGFVRTTALLEGVGHALTTPLSVLPDITRAVLTAVPLWQLGTARQRETYLPAVAAGWRSGGISLLELQGGAMDITAQASFARTGDGGSRLDARKGQLLGADQADHFLVTAADDPSGLSACLVERGLPGTCVAAEEGTLLLRGCDVPDDAFVGTRGAALSEFVPLLLALDRSVLLAPWLGIMRHLIQRSVRGAREGRLFGRGTDGFQHVRADIADMRARYELSAGLVHRAAAQLDSRARPSRADAAAAKLYVVEAARAVAERALRIQGMAGEPPSRFLEQVLVAASRIEHTGAGTGTLRSVVAETELSAAAERRKAGASHSALV